MGWEPDALPFAKARAQDYEARFAAPPFAKARARDYEARFAALPFAKARARDYEARLRAGVALIIIFGMDY